MIKAFAHRGLEAFYLTGSRAGINPKHAPRLARQLARLDAAKDDHDMNVPGWELHPLKGALRGHFAVSVSGNWRLTFKFQDGDAVLVNYTDYH